MAGAPRAWVDFNKWGAGPKGATTFLAPPGADELPPAADDGQHPPTHRQAFGIGRIALREGMVLRLMDLDGDEQGPSCTLEVDGTVGFDAKLGWYAEYVPDEMEWIPLDR